MFSEGTCTLWISHGSLYYQTINPCWPMSPCFCFPVPPVVFQDSHTVSREVLIPEVKSCDPRETKLPSMIEVIDPIHKSSSKLKWVYYLWSNKKFCRYYLALQDLAGMIWLLTGVPKCLAVMLWICVGWSQRLSRSVLLLGEVEYHKARCCTTFGRQWL